MVGLKVGPIFYKIGTGSLLYSFFSTIAYNLEDGKWGSRYPVLMTKLYKEEEVVGDNISILKKEIKVIRQALKEYAPSMIVWNFDDINEQPPWGTQIAERITSLSNYFYTNDGDDLFEVFDKAINVAEKNKKSLIIKSL